MKRPVLLAAFWLCLAAALGLGWVASQDAAGAADAQASEAAAPAGAQVFARSCSSCHGSRGQGFLGPALAGDRNLADRDYVIARVLVGGGGMLAFHDRLGPAEIASVVNYVRSSWGNDYEPVAQEEVAARWWGGAEDPGELYARVCSRCHGDAGGGYIGPPLAGDDNLASAGYVIGKVLHGSGGMPAFRGLLSDAQVAAVASYVRSAWGNDFGPVGLEQVEGQPAPEGQPEREAEAQPSGLTSAERERLFAQNCAACHGSRGGGGLGPALAGDARLQDTGYVVSRIVMGGGGMPPFNDRLSSAEIAAVATLIRTSWGNDYGAVGVNEAQDYHGGPSQLTQAQQAAEGRGSGQAPAGGGQGGLEIALAPQDARLIVTGPDRYLRFAAGTGGASLSGLTPGTYALSAAKAGYAAAQAQVEVTAGERASASLSLQPLEGRGGRLEIASEVEGIRLVVTGPDRFVRFVTRSSGETLEHLPAGDYAVSAAKEGYRASAQQVRVAPGETASLTLAWQALEQGAGSQ